jgi:hypothetical protein
MKVTEFADLPYGKHVLFNSMCTLKIHNLKLSPKRKKTDHSAK